MALPLGAHAAGRLGVIVYLGVFQIAVAYVLVTRRSGTSRRSRRR